MAQTTTRRRRPVIKPVNPGLAGRLEALARNLRWTWNPAAQNLFAAIDPAMWVALDCNPLKLIKGASAFRMQQLAEDGAFLKQLAGCEKSLASYMKAEGKAWFKRSYQGKDRGMRVAYFCAEFALHESFQIYSGGLGVLAGDHLKSASDLGVPLTAVGLLYRYGYYKQEIRGDGTTRPTYPPYDFGDLPVTDTGVKVRVPMGGGKKSVTAKVWKVQVGRVELFLLDTDHAGNKSANDRAITHHLYGGDHVTRIQQETLLGIGGAMALEELDITPSVYHLNEGHAAFAGVYRLANAMKAGAGYDDAVESIRQSTVFTTHTPVPAGHDRFGQNDAMRYLNRVMKGSGLSRRQVLDLASEDVSKKDMPFCMTVLALNLAERCNGVAELHGQVSREMWQGLYDVKRVSDVPIGHVTNGVHSQTWLAPEMYGVYEKYLKPGWDTLGAYDNPWAKAGDIPAETLWEARNVLRRRLVRLVRTRLEQQALRYGGDPQDLLAAHNALREDTLTIGFARRFATYKRATLLFKDLKRLDRIINDPKRPVQFVFAGKAHPADAPGQAFLQRIVEVSKMPAFRGKIVVVENYDMAIGRTMTAGCDVWLNNPLRPNEASGTSGMKPPLHGGINFSILDGWWPEGYNRKNGFVIGGEMFKSQRKQDAYDANSLYEIMEEQMGPMFYTRGRDGVPKRWSKMMVESMRSVCAAFSTHRMVGDYVNQAYLPTHRA